MQLFQRINQFLKNNQFLKPIISALNLEQLFLFIVLVGLFPAISDYSLFYLSGISYLEIFFNDPIFLENSIVLRYLPSFLLPIGLVIIVLKKNPWGLSGILPSILVTVILFWRLLDFEHIETYALISSIVSKIAFVYFVIKGKIRSLSFFVFSVLMIGTLYQSYKVEYPLLESCKMYVIFLLFCLIFRLLYLSYEQNSKIFSKIKSKRLLKLSLISLVMWSPILLFAIPERYASHKLDELVVNTVYNETFVKKHNVAAKFKLQDLIAIDLDDLIKEYNSQHFYTIDTSLVTIDGNETGITRLLADQNKWVLDKTAKPAKAKLLQDFNKQNFQNDPYKQSSLIKALVRIDAELHKFSTSDIKKLDHLKTSKDFRTYYKLHQRSKTDSLDRTDVFLLLLFSKEIEKIVIHKRFPGKSELELDAILSAHELISGNQQTVHQDIQRRNERLNESFEESQNATNDQFEDFIYKSNNLASDVNEESSKATTDVKRQTDAINGDFSAAIDARLNNLRDEANSRIDTLPMQSKKALDDLIYQNLTDFCKGCADKSCKSMDDIGFSDLFSVPERLIEWFGCQIKEKVKRDMRNAYKTSRDKALYDINREVSALSEEAKKEMNKSIDSLSNASNELTEQTTAEIQQLADNASSSTTKETNIAILKTQQEAAIKAKAIQAELKKIQDKMNTHTAATMETVNVFYEDAKTISSDTIIAGNKIIEYNKLLGSLLLLLLIIKSYAYVFSRVAFKEQEDLYISLKDQEKSYVSGGIKHCGTAYSIPANHEESFFISRKYRPIGRAPKVGVPCWTNSVIRRIKTNTYLMNHISIQRKNEESIDFHSLAGAEFIEWTLGDGEEVVFDYKNLVALTSDVDLRTEISVKVTSTLFGKTFFHIAKGPGKIVLMTKGKPLTEQQDQSRSVHIDRVIAWQKSTEFSVISELNLADIYLSGLYLKKASDDIVLIDADETSKKRSVGIARFIGKFLIPT